MAEKLSNVIGAPFPEYVMTQLEIRAAQNSTTTRTNDQILFLANKSAWVRLISSVNISIPTGDEDYPTLGKFYERLQVEEQCKTSDDLAKNWILQAGTSQNIADVKGNSNGISLRYGIGSNGAYGLGGTEELGYRPMPGLTSVTIDTAGTLGSLRIANISFQVWNINQLNVIEALYFRLGYSMLLEWGHTQYYANTTSVSGNLGGTFTTVTNTFGLDNPFGEGVDKVIVQQKIGKKAKETFGNYDGMLAIVSNFTWSMNQEGGYDCTVKLVGLGSVIDTLRVNQSYKMPAGLLADYERNRKSLEDARKRKEAQDAADKKAREDKIASDKAAAEAKAAAPPKVPNNPSEIYTGIYALDIAKNPLPISEAQFLINQSYFPNYLFNESANNTIPDYYYQAQYNSNLEFRSKINRSTGLFLNNTNGERKFWNLIPADVLISYPQPVSVNIKKLIYDFDFYYHNNSILDSIQTTSAQTSFDIEALPGIGSNNNYISTALGNAKFKAYGLAPVAIARSEKGIKAKTLPAKIIELNMPFIRNSESVKAGTEAPFVITSVHYAPVDSGKDEKPFYFFIKYVPDTNEPLTEEELITAVDAWFSTASPTMNVTSVTPEVYTTQNTFSANVKFNDLVITATPVNLTVPKKTVPPQITFVFNNTAYIENVLPRPAATAPPVNNVEVGSGGDTGGSENSSTTVQTDAASGYESALHIFLSFIKTNAEALSIKSQYNSLVAFSIDLTSATQTFYSDGILKNVFSTPPPATVSSDTFNVTAYAQKGFNSNLMLNSELYPTVTAIDFQKLSKAYLVRYQISNATAFIDYPVYITLGYLLAFLNNMCLIYDSRQATGVDKTPYVYIDFDPEANFCLTSPQHLSIDPTICLIPFEGNNESYRSIFPEDIAKDFPGIYTPASSDFLSKTLPKFKGLNGNQGKTMNLLLSVDYLLKTANNFATSDPEHAINLKGYLEAIMVDVNKCLGGINLFRVAYRDDTNTVQIKDDQWVPGLAGEPTALNQAEYLSKSPLALGQLPVFGLQSLVRSMQFQTNLSTKLSSMIAISAQAATGSVNATDPSSLGYLNRNYVDRFKPHIKEASGVPSAANSQNQTTTQTKDKKADNDIKIAQQFDTHVKGIYSTFNLDLSKVDAAKNYYIERMSKVKSVNPAITAAPFIPADLEITIDGIGGIVMGNAFTIPQNRLPNSLRGKEGKPKVGFIVAGLTHTIEGNQWLTKIRGQMIKLRGNGETDIVSQINQIQKTLQQASQGGLSLRDGTDCGCKRCYKGACGPDPKTGERRFACDGKQVEPPDSVNSQNFSTTYYPGYVFEKGVSDIPVTNPLTESEIVDLTTLNRFDLGKLNSPVPKFVIHHTGGLGSAKGTIDTFYCRGLPAQYVIDRKGIIHRFLPDGAKGWQAGRNYNAISQGVEVAAMCDSCNDENGKYIGILPIQVEAATRLAQFLGYKKDQIVTHGEIAPRDKNGYRTKEEDEGKTIADHIRSLKSK